MVNKRNFGLAIFLNEHTIAFECGYLSVHARLSNVKKTKSDHLNM